MNVIEPAGYQREVQLLPGSKERAEIQVKSLEELKQELNRINRTENRRTKLINRGIVISSIMAVVFLILNGDKDKASKINKTLRIIGYALSILAFIKGVSGSSSNLNVIEPNGENEIEKKFSDTLSTGDKLRVLSVRAVIDVMNTHKIVDSRTLKHRSLAFRFRSPKGSNKTIINEIANYGRKL